MCFSEMHLPALPRSVFPPPSSITQNSSEGFPKGHQDTKQLSHVAQSLLFLTYYVTVEGPGEVWTRLSLCSIHVPEVSMELHPIMCLEPDLQK